MHPNRVSNAGERVLGDPTKTEESSKGAIAEILAEPE
jgi:hypothetical protein